MNITRNGNSTTQACAACKYQRRKCAPDCILAPYFPHYRQRQFLNAHKLFGVSNITKIIKNLNPQDKENAMRTIMYQSDVRAIDPVGGCLKIIRDLQDQIEYNRAELELVLQQLAVFRAQAQQQQQGHHHVYNMSNAEPNNETVNSGHDQVINGDPLCNFYNNPNTAMHYHYIHQQQPHEQEQYLVVQENNIDTRLQQEDVHQWDMKNSTSLHGKNSVDSDDQYENKSFLEIPSSERNDRLEFEVDELIERSDEAFLFKVDNALLKAEDNSIQHAQDHDLKGAATLFTLTNCN
ncbi:LOB domain protein [Quillaja saponaria]|uniref:LOB domain protein n=1 Tax=Quillaja saponaria TaxID=32244 RepID=A0AAD7L565_QUISA|nr:LOB domain protein [Quillaja saponaria]